MSPVLAVKRCSRVTAARAAYFLHDQDPNRTHCSLTLAYVAVPTRRSRQCGRSKTDAAGWPQRQRALMANAPTFSMARKLTSAQCPAHRDLRLRAAPYTQWARRPQGQAILHGYDDLR